MAIRTRAARDHGGIGVFVTTGEYRGREGYADGRGDGLRIDRRADGTVTKRVISAIFGKCLSKVHRDVFFTESHQ